ncbi:MAG: guanylate kinase [Candidatus Neomarinimicrobiota bacterium]|nr:MAG: guanylate kinase [Candidatus Neomarinimicrobiota bacterium]
MINFITISAPSGSGKTTLCKALQLVEPEIEWSISYTTREKRSIEENGVDYFFISEEEFEDLIIQGHFVEWQNVHGFYYGTSVSNLENAIKNDKIMLIEMDVKGSMSIKKLFPDQTFSIFIMPPGISQLRERLRSRGTDSERRINIRLKRFQEEMEFREKFDYVMINEDLDLAKIELQKTINKLKQGVTSGT